MYNDGTLPIEDQQLRVLIGQVARLAAEAKRVHKFQANVGSSFKIESFIS